MRAWAGTRARRFAAVDSAPCLSYAKTMTWDAEIDAAGLLCPLPVLRARKRLLGMAPGQILRVVASDPASIIDIPHFCAGSGDALLSTEQEGDLHVFLIRKGLAEGAAQ